MICAVMVRLQIHKQLWTGGPFSALTGSIPWWLTFQYKPSRVTRPNNVILGWEVMLGSPGMSFCSGRRSHQTPFLWSGLERDSPNIFVNANMKAFPLMWVYFGPFWTALCLGKGIFCTDTNMRGFFLNYSSIVLIHVVSFQPHGVYLKWDIKWKLKELNNTFLLTLLLTPYFTKFDPFNKTLFKWNQKQIQFHFSTKGSSPSVWK